VTWVTLNLRVELRNMSKIQDTVQNTISTSKIETAVKPFLRWAGGKQWFVKKVLELTEDIEYNNYYEPFLGGGSVFFALKPNVAFLSDLNSELIKTYETIKSSPHEVINRLKFYSNTEKSYYRARKTQPRSDVYKAARFIYLNGTSYNGIYRVNKDGVYNVPYGYRKNYNVDETNLLHASAALKNATLSQGDFMHMKNKIVKNDLIFLDPPYTVSHNDNGFIAYNQKLFSLDDQKRLAKFIEFIDSKGAYYILTNAAHEEIGRIFDKCDQPVMLERASTIGGSNAKRGKVTEYIFTNIDEDLK
jgi:DNA adenine methylase (dam)